MSQTFADNLLPASTGYDLGSATQRWDLYGQNLDISGALTFPAWSGYANVKEYGAVGDGRAVTHAVATSGNTTLVDTLDSPWVPADVGKTITIHSQAYSPGLVTTITAVTDSSHVVLAIAPSSSGSVNAIWGTDDTAAIALAVAAITAQGSKGTLYFPQGIYMTSAMLSIVDAQGLVVAGQGAASAMSLGNYNSTGQPATGTALVWIGAQGSLTGVGGENIMLRLSGQFSLHDIGLIGSQLVSHNLQVGGTAASTSFTWSVARVNSGYARQYGLVVGGTGSDQGGNFGEASVRDVFLGGNGIPNTAAAENDETGGGDIFVRYGPGNFQVVFDSVSCNSATGLNGNHRIFWYSGNFGIFNNCYCSPLTTNSTPHSSIYVKDGNCFSFHNHYDENGYMLHAASGTFYQFNQVQIRKDLVATPHFAMQFDGVATCDFNGVSTEGLPIVFKAGGRVSRNNVINGPFAAGAAYPMTLCSGAGCISRVGSTVTVTTTATHPYVAGDWVSLAGIADATYNGTFKVVAPVTATQFDVVNAAAVGASTQGGTVGLASGIVAETVTNYIPQYSHPFINFSENFNGSATATNADILAAAATNLANKNAITVIPANEAGANGASLPATIPAGFHFLDLRGSTPTFYGGSYGFGSALSATGDFSAPSVLITGSSTHAGSVRAIDGGATSTNLFYNVPTGGTHFFAVNGASKLRIDGSVVTVTSGRMLSEGTAPTCAFTSGGGTSPSCTLDTGSTDLAGTIIATTGTGTPGAAGTITLTFSAAYGTNHPVCVYSLSNIDTGQWNARATVIDSSPLTSSDVIAWDNNGVALTASTAYRINYICVAK